MTGMTLILLLPVLIGVAVVLVMACRFEWSAREGERIQEEPVGEPFSVLSIALSFDPDHAIVWETQVPALELISAAGPQGVNLRRLQVWYLQSAFRYPELYDGFSFRQWLEFLEKAQLIVCHGRQALITHQGSEFLHYRITTDMLGAAKS